jgi:hypothetical protein
MSGGKTVRLFLADGTPGGLLTAALSCSPVKYKPDEGARPVSREAIHRDRAVGQPRAVGQRHSAAAARPVRSR